MTDSTPKSSSISRRGALATLLGAFIASTTGAEAQGLNDGFAGVNKDFGGLNRGDSVPGGLPQRAPTTNYDRRANPQLWDHSGIRRPSEVGYAGTQPAGSLVLDHKNQLLYYVLGRGRAMEYVVGVGRKGLEITGLRHSVAYTMINPTWDGVPTNGPLPHPRNPLGVRAIVLQDAQGVNHGFAIHGTNAPERLRVADGQRKVSGGCIRMHNEDVLDLFPRVRAGTPVFVYYRDEVRPLVRRGTGPALQP